MPQTRPIERKLTTILAADAANYSGRMHTDEEGTVRALRAARAVIDASITGRGGRIANTSGDGLIAEFPSVVDAVSCAVNIQTVLNDTPDHLSFRLGVHLGDVIVEGQDLLGDGVNLAARLQEMADVGGILISQQVYDQVRRKLGPVEFRPLGPATPKHLQDEVGVYAVVAPGIVAPRLPDNLGPKVHIPPPPPPVLEDGAPTPSPEEVPPQIAEMRRKFRKDGRRLGAAIGAIVLVEIIFDLSPVLTVVPTVALAWILFSRWRKLKAAEATEVQEESQPG
ncbi:adenylate/guanylate cyclase domain-containing protein [uncultured Tateyamaria sp.]|uniref:adenylate/guanylate cyclase domain-containing protein n=1 Tax=Tateyamaria sp. 1078 TaxID=3417464 RepID=UPI0026312574|nr:adenylate/guanylate cyclase domain-containing protein [uncultured Tateyamaria sp.]